MKKNECLNRNELLEKLSAKPEKIVDVPDWGKITIQPPNFEKVVKISRNNEDLGEKTLNIVLILMSIKELTPEDVLEIAKSNDGFAVAQLVGVVSKELGLAENVGKPIKG